MCFSYEVSIGTFLVSWGISLYLLNKGLNKKQKQNIIFLMIFSSIQLADAILWYNGMKKNNVPTIKTKNLRIEYLYKLNDEDFNNQQKQGVSQRLKRK